MSLDTLFNQVSKVIQNHSSDQTPGPSYNSNPVIGALQGIFGQYANQNNQSYNRQADYDDGEEYTRDYDQGGGILGGLFGGGNDQNAQQGQFGDVKPASQDPYGDPADQDGSANSGQFGNVLPASQDPYGDPADQERR